MKYKLNWAGLADHIYYEIIAKHCLPSWRILPGKKYVIHDKDSIHIADIEIVEYNKVENKHSKFLLSGPSKKSWNFWRKMQSQVYAIRNLKKCDFLILLDTDIEVLEFDLKQFEDYLDKLVKSNYVWATGESNRGGHDSGFIVLNMKHPKLRELTDHYENIWESGEIFNLKKWYDGNAVESMFDLYPSLKIKNIDYGQGFHVYDIGFVHYGSKIPKQMRIEYNGPGKDLVEKKVSETTVKNLKSVPQDQ
jgi:hypothetical protein